jgi:hypothetical protein
MILFSGRAGKTLVTTTRMGQSTVCMDKGTTLGKRDTTLSHRHTFSENYSSDRLLYNLLLKLDEYYSKTIKGLSEGDGRGDQEEHLVRDGGFFEGSWGQGFHQDVGSVCHVCGYCGLETGVSVSA